MSFESEQARTQRARAQREAEKKAQEKPSRVMDIINKGEAGVYKATPAKITSFTGEWGFLSNFYMGENLAERLWGYPTTEHFFQAMKSTNKLYRDVVKSRRTPGQAKREGSKVELREDWEAIKGEVMLTALRAKFAPGTELATQLISTGDAYLVEGNNWHDNYWGDCSCGTRKACESIGLNMLGNLLMRVRAELKEEKS